MTKEDIMAWFDTFKYAWENLIDKSNPQKRKDVAKFLVNDAVAKKYFYFLHPDYMEEVEKVLKKELEWMHKSK